jgi:hypothetical protein
MLYAAIDIHKHVFQAAVLDPESGEVGLRCGASFLLGVRRPIRLLVGTRGSVRRAGRGDGWQPGCWCCR